MRDHLRPFMSHVVIPSYSTTTLKSSCLTTSAPNQSTRRRSGYADRLFDHYKPCILSLARHLSCGRRVDHLRLTMLHSRVHCEIEDCSLMSRHATSRGMKIRIVSSHPERGIASSCLHIVHEIRPNIAGWYYLMTV